MREIEGPMSRLPLSCSPAGGCRKVSGISAPFIGDVRSPICSITVAFTSGRRRSRWHWCLARASRGTLTLARIDTATATASLSRPGVAAPAARRST